MATLSVNSSCFPMGNHTLASCTSHPLPTQSGDKSVLPCEGHLLKWKEVWREGSPYSPELAQRKNSPGQETVSRKKILEYLWVRPEVQDWGCTGKSGANGKTRTLSIKNKRRFTLQCKSCSFNLMECI